MPNIYDRAEKFRQELLQADLEASGLLVDAYGQAWQRARQELDGALARLERALAEGQEISPAWLYQERRLENAMAQLEAGMRQFAGTALSTITDAQATAVEAAQRHLSTLVNEEAAGAGVAGVTDTFVRMPEEALGHLIGTLADGSPLRGLLEALPGDAGEVFAKALVEGVALGRNPRQIAGEVRDAMGGNLQRALTIARTEVLRSYRASSHLGMRANADVVKGWRWVCARQARTCAACWAMHGTEHPLEEHLDGHPNCRCTPLPITRTWEELGAPPGTPDTNPDIPQGPDEFAQLDAATQRAVLGPKKFEAYQDGRLELRDLVGRRDHAEWGTTRYERSLADLERHGAGNEAWRLGPIKVGEVPMPADLARAVGAGVRRRDLLEAAERAGLEPAELERALAQLPDLRAAARADAEAAREQAMGWLERNAQGGRMAKPPRSVRGVGTFGERTQRRLDAGGNWDWLEGLDPNEKRRLHRFWLSEGGQAPDELAQAIAFEVGGDSEAALEEWLHQTRVADAAGALARGRLPSMTGYGNLAVDELAPGVAADGYDLVALFDTDLRAATHLAQVWNREGAELAARALGRPTLGPAPWRMTPATYREELLELEYQASHGNATRRVLDRLGELIPDGLDDPLAPLPAEHLHQAIVALARQAGLA